MVIQDPTLDDIDRAILREERHAADLTKLAARKRIQGEIDWARDYEILADGHRSTAAEFRQIKADLEKRLAEIRAI
jgi:hypothetical protein